jgi:hypothetical protein
MKIGCCHSAEYLKKGPLYCQGSTPSKTTHVAELILSRERTFQALAEVDVVPPITTSTLTTHQDVSQAIDMDIR